MNKSPFLSRNIARNLKGRSHRFDFHWMGGASNIPNENYHDFIKNTCLFMSSSLTLYPMLCFM